MLFFVLADTKSFLNTRFRPLDIVLEIFKKMFQNPTGLEKVVLTLAYKKPENGVGLKTRCSGGILIKTKHILSLFVLVQERNTLLLVSFFRSKFFLQFPLVG